MNILHKMALAAVCFGLTACMHPQHPIETLALPIQLSLENQANSEVWYQAEWFLGERNVAFLSMLSLQPNGNSTLLATSLTGQELFALQQDGQNLTILHQQPETKRLPLSYIYRDISWATASIQAFNTMQAQGQHFHANTKQKTWQKNGMTLWQAQLQDDGSWLVDNKAASYQLRLTPIDIEQGIQ